MKKALGGMSICPNVYKLRDLLTDTIRVEQHGVAWGVLLFRSSWHLRCNSGSKQADDKSILSTSLIVIKELLATCIKHGSMMKINYTPVPRVIKGEIAWNVLNQHSL